MKTIDIQEQPILSFKRIVQIAISGVRYRLFRAAITVAVIAIAMAFLMNILSESLIKKSVADSARTQIEKLHQVDKWIARLSVPRTPEEIILDPSETADKSAFSAPLKSAGIYLTFFNELNYGRRRILVGSAHSTGIFDLLQDQQHQDAFLKSLANMKAVRFQTGKQEFIVFLQAWPDLKDHIKIIRQHEQASIDEIGRALNGLPLLHALKDAQGTFGEALHAAGFTINEKDAASLAEQARDIIDSHEIDDTINNVEIRQAVAARMDLLPGDITISLIWKQLRKSETAAWYLKLMEENTLDVSGLSPDRIEYLAHLRVRAKLLVKAEMLTIETGGGWMGIGQRMTWLALVSMLVCIVGIANAMLMSVTERFREIATLKCLGALNSFIMTVFLIEAGILGLVGGLAGTVIGLILCIIRMFFVFQSLLIEAFPWEALMLGGLISIAAGVLLAAVAAVYPSFRAARLAPMEAMRIE